MIAKEKSTAKKEARIAVRLSENHKARIEQAAAQSCPGFPLFYRGPAEAGAQGEETPTALGSCLRRTTALDS